MQNEFWFRPGLDGLPTCGSIRSGYSLDSAALGVCKAEAIQRLLTIYWRVSSLLAITIYLLIAALPVGFISGLMARILIPISLWFWVDLNEEIEDQPRGALKLTFNSWRWAIMSIVCWVIAQLPLLQCAISKNLTDLPLCRAWLEPPLLLKSISMPYHPSVSGLSHGHILCILLELFLFCWGNRGSAIQQ